jgi:hypothetical protein
MGYGGEASMACLNKGVENMKREIILQEWKELQATQCHGDSCDLCYYRQLELQRQLKKIDPDAPDILHICEKLNQEVQPLS